ncbi:hypothetical protein J6590_101048 [Homalodisca vitripennis]|nr:hypothetical protein J6590_101048 [Homalodisca vitripennis]
MLEISFTYSKNRTGPRTEPWGTPAPTEKLDEACLRRQHKSSTKDPGYKSFVLVWSFQSSVLRGESSGVKSSDMADTGVKVDGGVKKRKWRRDNSAGLIALRSKRLVGCCVGSLCTGGQGPNSDGGRTLMLILDETGSKNRLSSRYLTPVHSGGRSGC